MASETPVSDHHPAPSSLLQQEVEKDLESEVKNKAEAENVSAPTIMETPCSAPPPPAAAAADPGKPEAEGKVVDKPIEPPAATEEKKPEIWDPPVIESTRAVEDKPIVAPPAQVQKQTPKLAELMAEERTEDKAPAQEDKKIEDVVVPVEKSETKFNVESEPEPVGEVKGEEKHQELEKTAEPAKEKEEELPPPEVVEATKDVVVSEAVCKAGEPVVEAKLPEVVEHIEKAPPEAAPVDKVEVKCPLIEVEDIKTSKVDETCAPEGSDQIKLETPVIKAEEEKGVVEKVSGESQEVKEPAKEAIEVKEASEKKVEVEVESKPMEVKPEEKSVIVAEEFIQCDQKLTEGVTSSDPPPKPAEESAKPEVASRDIEPVVDNGNKKGETEASPETAKDVKVGEEAAAAVKEPEKTEAATEAKLEEQKQVDEPAKTDIEQSECNKDSQETTKITQDEPKEDLPTTKPQKTSLVKMMKQSLVKAKKAIIRKSNQNTKTAAPGSKEQGNK